MNISNLPTAKKLILKKRPGKDFDEENFEVVEDLAKAPEKDELLIKVDTLAIDAWIRTTLHEGSYHDSAQEGNVISALGIGEVLISKSKKFQEGDFVSGPLGAQTHSTMHAAAFNKIHNPQLDPEVNIGLIGLTSGLTAYFGLIDVGKVKEGETVVVSGAAGGVGIIVCQLAKALGAKVIAIAGGPEKCSYLLNDLEMDHVIDYKNFDVENELESIAKDKIDVFFDNVGGDILDAVLDNLNTGARVAICGAISQYSDMKNVIGPKKYLKLAENYARMEGFTVMHFSEKFEEATQKLLSLYEEGKIVVPTHYENGIESFPRALKMLFTGGHTGKLMVKI